MAPTIRSSRVKQILLDNLIIVLMIIAVILGIGLGFGLRNVWSPLEKEKIFYLQFPGDLLLNMLKLLILPLIVSSIITAMSSLNKQLSGRLGFGAIVYYFSTTLVSVILGIILVVSIQPGFRGDGAYTRSGRSRTSNTLSSMLDLVRNCFPPNIVQACFSKMETKIDSSDVLMSVDGNITDGNITDGNITEKYVTTVHSIAVTSQSGMNVLGLVVFSIFIGCTINHVGEKAKPLANLFSAINDVVMVLVRLVIWFSPIGILFLLAAKFVGMKDPEQTFTQLGLYFATVITGLVIHGGIILPAIYIISTRKNPFVFLYGMLKAIITAFGTASSSATLPITMDCLIHKNGVNPLIAQFIAPVGATINMDGTALYEAVAAIFIAQVNGITFGIADIIVVSLTATAAAVGAAGVPQAGLVTMLIVLNAVGLPTEDITLILAIDWLLDRFRTAINVIGDSFGAGILDHFLGRRMDVLTDIQIAEALECKDKTTNGDALKGDYNDGHSDDKVPNTKL